MKKLLILAIVIIGIYFAFTYVDNGEPFYIDTDNWETLSIDPNYDVRFQISHPSSWDNSELRFSCTDINAAILAVISPSKVDSNIKAKGTVSYLVQFCISPNGDTELVYSNFISAPMTRQLVELDKLKSLDKGYVESTEEYKTAQEIISSLKRL